MKDIIFKNIDCEFKLRIYNTQDFVICFIYEPDMKCYYVQHSNDIIHCTTGKNYSHLFTSRDSAQIIVDELKSLFNLDFFIESFYKE